MGFRGGTRGFQQTMRGVFLSSVREIKTAERADKIRCHPALPNTASGLSPVAPRVILTCNFLNGNRRYSAAGNRIEIIARNEVHRISVAACYIGPGIGGEPSG